MFSCRNEDGTGATVIQGATPDGVICQKLDLSEQKQCNCFDDYGIIMIKRSECKWDGKLPITYI